VNADEREEIAVSVAADAELGLTRESAVAEGLVERIGEEIDRSVVSHDHSSPAGVIMVLPIWAANAIINVAHSQRR
jgi:hypothetical protein